MGIEMRSDTREYRFRWVYLQVRSLENHITDDAVHNWAHKLPRNLTEAYDQLWDNMRGHDDFDVNLAERAIMWVLCSFEPLRSHILLEAIQYAVQGSTVVQKEKQTQQQILSLCQDLLTIDEERGVWMLPHASVAEYFESRGYTNWKCHVFASKVCLGVLENFWPEEIEYETFAEYVGDSWGRHVEEYDQWLERMEGENEATKADPDLTEALERFLGSPGESSDNYRQWAEHDEKRLNEFNPNNLSLLAACQYGLWYTLRDWWLNNKMTIEMVFEKNSNEETSLMLAAKSNCLPMVKHLVDLIDVMDQYAAENCVVALNCALAEEHLGIVKFFIMEAKVDVNLPSRSKDGITAAQVAIDFSPSALQWMLDQGLVDMQRQNDAGYMHSNVLITAVYREKVESVQILLKAGANANAVVHQGDNGSPLMAAVVNANPAIVRLLLEHGADPNLSITGNYGSALEASIAPKINERVNQKERDEIQRMLLDAGADPTVVSIRGSYGSALAAAAFWGEKEILTVMIDRVGAECAIQALRRSSYPMNIERYFKDEEDVQRWKDTITYLGQVGVSKEILHGIGLREDIELESTGLSSPGKYMYLVDYPKLNHSRYLKTTTDTSIP